MRLKGNAVVVAGFSLRKITQPKGCDYQFPLIIEQLQIEEQEFSTFNF